MLGVVLTVSGTSEDIPTKFSIQDVKGFFRSIAGLLYITILVFIILLCVIAIFIFEKKWPLAAEEVVVKRLSVREAVLEKDWEAAPQQRFGNILGQPSEQLELPFHRSITLSMTISWEAKSTSPLSHYIKSMSSFYVRPSELKKDKDIPLWIDKCMLVIYPGSLGLDEGVAHLSMKAFMALLSQCGETDTCGEAVLWLMILMWCFSSLATLWWLRTVFRRYETTRALPVEYGAVMAINACSGLIFYEENKYMESWQIVLIILGIFVILVGIIVGLRGGDNEQNGKNVGSLSSLPSMSGQIPNTLEDIAERPSMRLSVTSYDDCVFNDSGTPMSDIRDLSVQDSLKAITVDLGVNLRASRA